MHNRSQNSRWISGGKIDWKRTADSGVRRIAFRVQSNGACLLPAYRAATSNVAANSVQVDSAARKKKLSTAQLIRLEFLLRRFYFSLSRNSVHL